MILKSFLLLFYLYLFKEDDSIDEMIACTVAPRIIGTGKCGSLNPLYIVAEGIEILSLSKMSLVNALVLLVAVYYVFNIQYPKTGKNNLEFVEYTLLGNHFQTRNKVTINKFLKELELIKGETTYRV